MEKQIEVNGVAIELTDGQVNKEFWNKPRLRIQKNW